MKLDLWVRQTRASRGWGYAIDIYKSDSDKYFRAKPIVLEFEECVSAAAIPSEPSLYLTENEWNDLRGSLTNPMHMHGIHVSQLTVESTLIETREHLKTVKDYADRMLRMLEKAERWEG
jgi:hypothetical protein